MKQLNVTFEDKEYKILEEAKKKADSKNWREFLLELVK